MQDLVIFGTGGFGREVHQLVKDLNAVEPTWNFLGFLDGNPDLHGTQVHGYPVLGDVDWLASHPEVKVVVAVGNTPVRRKLVEAIDQQGNAPFATLVHPQAGVGDDVPLGEGTIICEGTVVTCDIRIGRHVILNLNCTVGHDAVLHDFVTVAPSVNISGNVTVGEGCDLGTGGAIIQGVDIGAWSITGAGAVVAKNLPPNVTAVGVPAKVIKEREAGWQLG